MSSLLAGAAHGAIIHDESIDGDLGSIGSSTPLGTFPVGVSSVLGSLGQQDQDSFTFIIDPGEQLNSIILTDWISELPLTFFGLVLDGVTKVEGSFSNVGTNILPFWSTTPLAAGPHTFELFTGTAQINSYGLDFVVSAVPEPSTALLLVLGLVGIASTQRRATHS